MHKKSKIFLIDIDGVACEHAKAVCEWVNNRYKINSKVEHITTWDHDFGPITFVQAVAMCYPGKDFILNMEVTPGFSEFLEAIRRIFVTKFVTKREYSHDATRHWVRRHFGEFDTYFVKSKKEVDFDYLIDDYIEDIITVASMGSSGGRKYFLLKRPWNDSKSDREKLKKLKQIHFIETFAGVFPFLK